MVAGIQDGSVDLTDPATTVALLKLNAVVGGPEGPTFEIAVTA